MRAGIVTLNLTGLVRMLSSPYQTHLYTGMRTIKPRLFSLKIYPPYHYFGVLKWSSLVLICAL